MSNLDRVGMTCKKGYIVDVLKSNSGYYIGTLDEDGIPNCRISNYGRSLDDPLMNISREEAPEIQYCNQGNCMIMNRCRR